MVKTARQNIQTKTNQVALSYTLHQAAENTFH